jgi:hypothetical protein
VSEPRLDVVVRSDGVRRANVERAHERALCTVVGEVRVSRIAYRARGQENLIATPGPQGNSCAPTPPSERQ